MSNPMIVNVGHPEKVNLVFFSDVHLAAKAPGRRRGTYAEEILGKMSWCAALATKLRGAAICGGDLFHVKNPKSDSNGLGFVNQTLATCQQFPTGAIYGAVGNHDISGDNLETLQDQPLGTLVQAGVYRDLAYQPVVFTPEVGGLRVQVDAYDYLPGDQLLAQLLARAEEIRTEVDAFEHAQLDWNDRPWHYRVAVVHAFNQPGASGLMFGADYALGHADLIDSGYDVILWGHDHSRKGIIHPKGGDGPIHIQLGSLARAALSADEVNRPVSVAVLSFSAVGINIIEKEVPVQPLELAFHTADVQVDKAEKREDVVQFLAELEAHADAVDSDNPMEILCSLTDDTKVIATITEVCELT